MAKNKIRELYPPILPRKKEWPIVKLSRNSQEFLAGVKAESFSRIRQIKPTIETLREEIEATHHKEKHRIKYNRWKVDPEDDILFWDKVKDDLLEVNIENEGEKVEEILRTIIDRYANEILSKFKPSYHAFAKRLVTFGFARLLNAARFKTLGGLWRNEYDLIDKINIVGHTQHMRSLAQQGGTIVMVPTHFSNLDSILIGWVIETLGLPPFIYGAGLNLFNIGIFSYFMNSLGAYKVDRRKKNLIYLETLKTYSSLALQEGIHSLFFPGGTRSRSGSIEKQLKLGLLSTTIEAQRIIYEKHGADTSRKIFIVPVTINYNFVLEAPALINDYLKRQGQERYYIDHDEFSRSHKILSFLLKFFTQGSNISVSVGRAMDVLGNVVDENGKSRDAKGRIIDPSDYFKYNNTITANSQRETEYTRMLADKITKEYHRANRIFPSHIVAFVAFELISRQYPKLDLYALLRLPEEDIEIAYDSLKEACSKLVEHIKKLHEAGNIDISNQLSQPVEHIIKTGVSNVGMYHAKKVLYINEDGNIGTQDLNLLYYYRNRSDGYQFENYF